MKLRYTLPVLSALTGACDTPTHGDFGVSNSSNSSTTSLVTDTGYLPPATEEVYTNPEDVCFGVDVMEAGEGEHLMNMWSSVAWINLLSEDPLLDVEGNPSSTLQAYIDATKNTGAGAFVYLHPSFSSNTLDGQIEEAKVYAQGVAQAFANYEFMAYSLVVGDMQDFTAEQYGEISSAMAKGILEVSDYDPLIVTQGMKNSDDSSLWQTILDVYGGSFDALAVDADRAFDFNLIGSARVVADSSPVKVFPLVITNVNFPNDTTLEQLLQTLDSGLSSAGNLANPGLTFSGKVTMEEGPFPDLQTLIDEHCPPYVVQKSK